MLEILARLAAQHDYRLVALAIAVCGLASLAAFRVYSRIRRSRGLVRASWLMLIGLGLGSGIWATHFIAMLGFRPGLPTGYVLEDTLVSLFVAVALTASAFALASANRRARDLVLGGIMFGVADAATFYSGMTAFRTEGVIAWSLPMAALSVLAGCGISVGALFAASRARSFRQQAVGAGLLTLAIATLHLTAMGAMSIGAGADLGIPPILMANGPLALAVAGLSLLVSLGALGTTQIDASSSVWALDRVRRLANAAHEGIVVTADGKINDANAAFTTLAGVEMERLSGRVLLGEVLLLDDAEPVAVEGRREGWLRPDNGGAAIPVEVFERALNEQTRGDDRVLNVLVVRDLRERRTAEEKIRYLAEHDALTGLPNRNALQTRLRAVMERVEATGESLAILCLDLDHFKEANDLHGHLAGDALLAEAARRLRDSVSAPSFAARLGGDEFIVVQVGGGEQPAAAGELASALLEAFKPPYMFEGHELGVSASIGVALHPDDGRDADALLACADMALYRAKDGGRNTFRFFKREMDETIRERRTLARELRQAIGDEQLMLHYQPLANTGDGQICGFEALVRWNHPTRGLVPPLSFIPLAEESGLIQPLGEWVLRRACKDAAAWEKPLRVAVNLSPLQLHQANLPALVHEVLLSSGLAPARLELEVTESALFKDYQRALDTLRRLKALGVRIAMDDFGTGFSSLSTLQSFPFDKIKIDKSFVENIHRHERATVIVRAVLGLGRSLDIPVVAEGVETLEQLEFLRGEDCAEVQGYHIGRPAPVEMLLAMTCAGTAIEVPAAPKRRKKAAA